MMKKLIIAILAMSATFCGIGQNINEVSRDIQESLERFASMVSYINDDDEPVEISTIAKNFNSGNSTYIYFNGRSFPDMEAMLQHYNSGILKSRTIEHEFDFKINSLEKISDKDRRWKIKAELLRNPSDMSRDYKIKPAEIEMIVKWNGHRKDVTILEINMPEALGEVYPTFYYVYNFTHSPMKTDFTREGGDWQTIVTSTRQRIKTYPGIANSDVAMEIEPVNFGMPAGDDKDASIKQSETDPTKFIVTGKIRRNYETSEKYYNYTFGQEESDKTLSLHFTQDKAPHANPFDFDPGELPQYYLSLAYDTKYTFGLKVMCRPEDSRFLFGLSVAFNGSAGTNWTSSDVAFVGYDNTWVSNGYRITQRPLNPKNEGYSSLFDPKNEAECRTAYYNFMLMAGFNITKWLRFDLGLGLANKRIMHRLENGFNVIEYSYQKLDSSLPDIPNVYSRIPTGQVDFCNSKYGAAIQPGLTFEIPLGNRWSPKALCIGVGYTIAAGIKKANSLNFSISYAFSE